MSVQMLQSPLMSAKNMEKRRLVMQRSKQLGHCICDPKKPCPCDIFIEKDVCPCAGERLDEAGRSGAADGTGRERRLRLEDRPGDAAAGACRGCPAPTIRAF